MDRRDSAEGCSLGNGNQYSAGDVVLTYGEESES